MTIIKCLTIVLTITLLHLPRISTENEEPGTDPCKHVDHLLEEEFRARLLSTLNKRAHQCEDKDTTFDEPIANTTNCFKELHSENETLCSTMLEHYTFCTTPIAEALETCLSSDLAGLGSNLVQASYNILHYLCSLPVEQVSSLTNQCIKEIDFMIATSKCVANTEQKIVTLFKDDAEALTFQDILCRIHNDVYPCFEIKVKTSCANPLTRESILGILDALTLTPCQNFTPEHFD